MTRDNIYKNMDVYSCSKKPRPQPHSSCFHTHTHTHTCGIPRISRLVNRREVSNMPWGSASKEKIFLLSNISSGKNAMYCRIPSAQKVITSFDNVIYSYNIRKNYPIDDSLTFSQLLPTYLRMYSANACSMCGCSMGRRSQ